jgi:dUTP pyrophosphatase
MKIKVKKLNQKATVPKYAKDGDAGLDLVATSKEENAMFVEYGTGLSFEIPEGHMGLIFPRSSISKYHLNLANSVGVIDSGYRGEVKIRFKKTSTTAHETLYNVGDKVCQLIVMPFPRIEIQEVSELSNTERGDGGFGSSGA